MTVSMYEWPSKHFRKTNENGNKIKLTNDMKRTSPTVRWMPSNCGAYHVVSGLGLTRLERKPWSFWKARVLDMKWMRLKCSLRYAALNTIVFFFLLLFVFFLILARILTRTRTNCVCVWSHSLCVLPINSQDFSLFDCWLKLHLTSIKVKFWNGI